MTTLQPAPTEVADRPTAAPEPAVDVVQERLDEPVVLVPRMVWALLAAVLIAVAATVTWLVAGSWPRHVAATGVLVHGTGPDTVTAPGAGTVTAVDVTPGSVVRAGTPLGTVGGSIVRAASAGVVVAVDVGTGGTVRAGDPLFALDPSAAPAAGYLLVADHAELARRDLGQRVDFAAPGGTVRGRIDGIEPAPTDAAALRARWGLPVPGLPRPGLPVWVVRVALPRSTAVALGPTDATVTLRSIRPYQLVFGGRS